MGWKIKFSLDVTKKKNGNSNIQWIPKFIFWVYHKQKIILTHVFTANSNGRTNKLQMPNECLYQRNLKCFGQT